jgi:UDP-glucose 4-epimerase
MTTLVTGGRGFVGRHLVDHLLTGGEQVVSYNRDHAVDDRPGLAVVQGELFDVPRLVRTLTAHGVERVIHTAGMSHPGVSIDMPIGTFAGNVEGTVSVFEAARMAGVRRVVNFSSECAYGHLDETAVVHEDARPEPTTPYGVTKVAGELLGKVYRDLYDTEVVSLRVTEVYGPGLWMPSLLGDMVRAAVRGKPFTLDRGGEHLFQFVYVGDVAAAAHRAAVAPAPPQHVYHVSGGAQITLADAAEAVRAQVPDVRITLGGGHLEQWDRQGRFDLAAAERDLGYRPRWSFADGLRATIDWVRSHERAGTPG